MKMEYTLKPEDAGKKIRQVLQEKQPLSIRARRWLKFHAQIFIDDVPHRLQDLIPEEAKNLRIEMDAADRRKKGTGLQVAYEDEYLLVVYKPSGMMIHVSKKTDEQNQQEEIQEEPKEKPVYLCDMVRKYLGAKSAWPVGRLDQEVAGFMVFGKNFLTASMLEIMRTQNKVKKTYTALCHGPWDTVSGTIEAPIAKTEIFNRYEVSPEGKEARSHYHVIKNSPLYSLVQVQIETGRTHQIRLHMRHMGHPIVGDQFYGIEVHENQAIDPDSLFGHCQLYAARLEIEHPITHERLLLERQPDFSSLFPEQSPAFFQEDDTAELQQ